MEKVIKAIDIHRSAFARIYDNTLEALEKPDKDLFEIQGNTHILQQKIETLSELNQKLMDFILDDNSVDVDPDDAMRKADSILEKYQTLKYKVEHLIHKEALVESMKQGSSCNSNSKRKLKLPMIEFKKYGGDIKEWLSFWSQFRRIHEDEQLENEDKFQYLVQATLPKSRARQLVESFPPTKENYEKVIDCLKSRFGRDDLLVEVYVRELLKLILNNVEKKTKLTILYDQLESQLRALETLGVTSEKCAAMLYPLVESCLPEETLRAWQRDPHFSTSASLKTRLDDLMNFLKKEVENEERIHLASSGFDIQKKVKKDVPIENNMIPTASGLINRHFKNCIFCGKEHLADDCIEAMKLTLLQRKKKLSEKGCCHLCLKFGHVSRKCRTAGKLQCKTCSGRHSFLMCPKSNESEIVSSNVVQLPTTAVENLSNQTYNEVFLQTIVVQLNGNSKSRKVRAIIDTGSQRSYISKPVAVDMELEEIRREQMIHALFGGYHSESVYHSCYNIGLESLDRNYACCFEVLDQPVICSGILSIRQGPWMNELEELGIKIHDTTDGPIEVLIGADVAGKLFTGQKRILKSGLIAMETLLGWTLMGKLKESTRDNHNFTSMMAVSLLSRNIADLWNLEILGIIDPGTQKTIEERETAVKEHFIKTVTLNKLGRYEVSMPWIEDHPPLPDNFDLAKSRLDNLMQKLTRDGYYAEYEAVFQEWLAEGIIENVPETEYAADAHYLPHRHVVKLNSTTKIRPVFDASARKKNNPSLNQCLEKGINLISLIPSIILTYRLGKIGVISDIRKAFLQISLSERDRNFVRFLWYNEHKQIVIFRHVRVVFGITSSPYLLGAVIEHHLKKTQEQNIYSASIMNKLMKSFYVDNCVTSVDNERELHEFIQQSIDVMKEGKFDLRGWEYTSTEDKEEPPLSPVLGLLWNRKLDTLQICLEGFKNIDLSVVTKRIILSAANRLFDPIGFICPVLLCPKILLQKSWSIKLGWNTEVPEVMKQEFLAWMSQLNLLVNLKIPRWIFQESPENIYDSSLHLFCDASKEAYAAVIFLRSESSLGNVSIQLVQAKSRVSPLKKISIPRLELLAATIGARLLSSILKILEIDVKSVYCWTDSTTVLSWIKRDVKWKTFINNRVREICSLTNGENWYHVPGKNNPADLPSRGCSSRQLIQSRWWEGPQWLLESADKWPAQDYKVDEESVQLEKLKGVTSLLSENEDFSWIYRYFSKYSKIVNMIGWMKRFVYNCQNKNNRKTGQLEFDEIEKAEQTVIRLIQEETFSGVEDARLASLMPFKDDFGIIRLRTRITERQETGDFCIPMILPSKHPVVNRIIFACHIRSCHSGTQILQNILRERFWILGGRKTIRSVISKCMTCRKNKVSKLESASVPLPKNRVKDAAVFEVTGVDLAGPLYLRNGEKVWICIFTCAVYRAIHLELVTSMSTYSFLQALRRFIARRGRPSIIYSDNGRCFVGAENAFSVLNWEEISGFSTAEKISWKFNPPYSAWWGGWWERLIGIVKFLLKKVLGKARLNFEELSSVLCDCESVVNSRPLTVISEDSSDLAVLSSVMFLNDIKEVGVLDLDKVEANGLRRRYRYKANLRGHLQQRFRNEYLSQLFLKKKRCNENIKIGEIVLVGNDHDKRIEWPLARVLELFPGKDGKVRLVKLKTATGTILRPIQRLFPLEVDSQEDNDNLRKNNIQDDPGNEDIKKSNVIETDQSKYTRCGRRIKPPDRYSS